MGDLWRSQEMQLLSLIIQNDTAHDVISKMGELGLVDFRDVSMQTTRAAATSPDITPFAPLHPADDDGSPDGNQTWWLGCRHACGGALATAGVKHGG